VISRALISVSDKTGIVEFAQGLHKKNIQIISTGGTAKALMEAKIPVTPIEEITQFPECFSGRVKTMHPAVMGGILFRRGDRDHEMEAEKLGIEPIDLVVVNLYPFESDQQVEQIDIGGPTLLRSAAKNYQSVTVVWDPADYDRVLKQIEKDGDTSEELRKELSAKVFLRTAQYDNRIASWLSEGAFDGLILKNKREMRYGENPHQTGAYYDFFGQERPWKVLQEEKQMSYLNILDADGAWNLVQEFEESTAACIKHANPSGVASHTDISEAFQRSYDTDKLSAFGVIIALNRECPAEVVQKIIDQKIFAEIIIAPEYEEEALELLKQKPKLRVIAMKAPSTKHQIPCLPNRQGRQAKESQISNSKVLSYRSVLGGMLVQDEDSKVVTKDDLKVVTSSKPSAEQIGDLLFAWKVVKHAKSNAIVFAKDKVTVGIGCGQTSRVDSTWIAGKRAGDRAKGAAMASDAFFPFPDAVETAAEYGISAIIQPGGSIRDEEVFKKAEELELSMVVTGVRGFRH